jgi:hypothetical protein
MFSRKLFLELRFHLLKIIKHLLESCTALLVLSSQLSDIRLHSVQYVRIPEVLVLLEFLKLLGVCQILIVLGDSLFECLDLVLHGFDNTGSILLKLLCDLVIRILKDSYLMCNYPEKVHS